MTVSAVIPTFNRAAEVLRAIDSVLAQTVPVKEIIVVDDGSDDGTVERINNRYGAQVHVVCQSHRGASAARNTGVGEANGEWIAFLDSDDVWLPTKVQCQLDVIAAMGDSFGVCFTDSFYMGDPERKASRFTEVGFHISTAFGALEQPASVILANKEPFFTPTVMIRRSVLNAIPGFDESLTIGEDTDVFFRLTFVTRFCFVGQQLVSVDRTPKRSIGLCNLYLARDDRKYKCLEQRFQKWLAMPEVTGTEYDHTLRAVLRNLYYDSIECKARDLRVGPVICEAKKLATLGDDWLCIAANLFARKMRKLRMTRASQNQMRASSAPRAAA